MSRICHEVENLSENYFFDCSHGDSRRKQKQYHYHLSRWVAYDHKSVSGNAEAIETHEVYFITAQLLCFVILRFNGPLKLQ